MKKSEKNFAERKKSTRFAISIIKNRVMTVKEGKELVAKLEEEIQNGVDVEFNKNWIRLLNNSILKASIEGFNKGVEKLNKKPRN